MCATGHRVQHFRELPAGTVGWVRSELVRIAARCRDDYGTAVAISGMAIGVDLWWADAAVRAGLELHAYIPFPQQTSRWRDRGDVAEWRRLCEAATVVKTLFDYPDVRFLHARNRAMLAASTACVCVWHPGHRHGGTWNAVRSAHAMLAGREFGVHVNPLRMRTTLGLPRIDTSTPVR